jgi:peroxiredoxin Q/BCP
MPAFQKFLSAATAGIFSACTAQEPLADGAPLPDVSQENQDGATVKLAQLGGDGYLLVYFYPKADTPGCTKQACSLRDSYAKLTEMGVKVLGVSMDTPAAQKAFRNKYQLPFDLLADHNGTVVKAFGVPSKLKFPSRQAFLFKDGKLVWRDLKASTDKQAADVLAIIGESR